MGRRVPGPDSKPYGYVTVRASTPVKNRCGEKSMNDHENNNQPLGCGIGIQQLSSPSRLGLMSGVDY